MGNQSSYSESWDGEIKDDLLNITPFVESIKEELLKPNSYTGWKVAAIYGDWGSGKTHCLKQLAQFLADEGNLICFFSAWEHEQEGNIATSLLNNLTDIDSYKFNFNNKPYLRYYIRNPNIVSAEKEAMYELLGILSGLDKRTQVINNLLDLSRMLKTKRDPETYWPSIRKLRKKFNKLVLEIKKNTTEQLYIFIDDLDRCTPKNLVKFIEQVKNLFQSEECKFVLALDRRATAIAIQGEYSGYLQVSNGEKNDNIALDYGMPYLDKIIDIHFEIPIPINYEKLMLACVGKQFQSVKEYLDKTLNIQITRQEESFINLTLRYNTEIPRKSIRAMYLFSYCVQYILRDNTEIGDDYKYANSHTISWLLYYCLSYENTKSLKRYIQLEKNRQVKTQSTSLKDVLTEVYKGRNIDSIDDRILSGPMIVPDDLEFAFLQRLIKNKYAQYVRSISTKANLIQNTK